MVVGGKNTQTLTRVLAITLIVLLGVFLTQAATHTHQNGQNETTCQVCQSAHLGPTLPSGISSVLVPLRPEGYVEPFVAAFHQEFFFHDSPSRAPPSFFL